jgi:hypothetical protein
MCLINFELAADAYGHNEHPKTFNFMYENVMSKKKTYKKMKTKRFFIGWGP